MPAVKDVVSRVRENRMPGSMRRREEAGANGLSAARYRRLAYPTATLRLQRRSEWTSARSTASASAHARLPQRLQ